MSNQNYFENKYSNQRNYNIDSEQENTKKNFDNSIASLGDIYKLAKKNETGNVYTKNMRANSKNIINKNNSYDKNNISNTNINHVYLSDPHQHRQKEEYNNLLDNSTVAVNFLKSAKTIESKKYSHVRSGKINPTKTVFSVKQVTENKIKQHENNVKGITLYANRVNIEHYVYEHKREPSPIKTSNEYPSDDEQYKHVVAIGQAPQNNISYNNNTPNYEYMNKTQQINSSQLYHQRNLTVHNQSDLRKSSYEKNHESTKENRNILKIYDNLYSITKDFFISNSNKVPSRGGIDDIIHNADEMRTSLQNYKKRLEENLHNLQKTKNIDLNIRPKTGHLLKDSIKIKKKAIKPKSPKKYLDINPDDRRKIEEKLESLHVEIRIVFDNMNGIENKNQKVDELIHKSQILSNLLKSFSLKINGSVSMSQFNLNHNQGLGESVNSGLNLNNSIAKKRNEVDEVIDVLKGGMGDIPIDDNKILFDHSGNNFNQSNQTNNYNHQNNNAYNSLNLNQSFGNNNSQSQFSSNNNFNPTASNNFNPTASNNFNPIATNNFNPTASNNFNPLESNNFSSSVNHTNNEKSIVNYAGTTNSLDPNIDNKIPNSFNNTSNKLPIYPKISTTNIIRDERFTAYDIELPINYYYNMTKSNEPNINKDWYLRPHHTETISGSPNAIPDDIINTKYISYYAPVEKIEKTKNREECIGEAISNLEYNIDKLKSELFTKATINEDYGKLYERNESLKEEAKQDYIPGKVFEDFSKAKLKAIQSQPKDYSDGKNKNENLEQTNMVISSYETLLKELRDRERFILLQKRSEQYEKIRPPVEKWWEMRTGEFKDELQRNKMYINANSDYFEKIEELQNKQLY